MKILIDKEPKTPKYKKNGEYTAASARILSDTLGSMWILAMLSVMILQ